MLQIQLDKVTKEVLRKQAMRESKSMTKLSTEILESYLTGKLQPENGYGSMDKAIKHRVNFVLNSVELEKISA